MSELLYVAVVMIAYDFSLHLMETVIGNKEKVRKKWYYWPPLKIFGDFENRKIYNYFWTIYWGIVFILVILSLLYA